MTQPDPQDPDEDEPNEQNEAYDPEDHPHPLRAKDVAALIPKELG